LTPPQRLDQNIFALVNVVFSTLKVWTHFVEFTFVNRRDSPDVLAVGAVREAVAVVDISPVSQRRARLEKDLEQDLEEEGLLLEAARSVLRLKGVSGMTVRDVLAQANLGTRAFYRHFASKDELVLAMFTRAAAEEAERLKRKMAPASDPVTAVIAWIDGRLDLAFDRRIAANLHDLSTEAQLRRRETPAELQLAFDMMLAPLVEQLRMGQERGLFAEVDPEPDARSIHNVVWGVVEAHWSGFPQRKRETRDRVVRFCLQAIGTSGDVSAFQDVRRASPDRAVR
jgi:AcrR family transcriptional regulator